jgi:Domain of unknown function (DUF4873)
MTTALPEDEYAGPAVIEVGERRMPVRVTLSGRFEPVDGRYHWGGRLAPDGDIADLLRSGQRAVTVQIGHRIAVQARLAEIDPWGGIRVTGVSRPPWATPSAPPGRGLT